MTAGTVWAFVHIFGIVAYGVAATSGLPDREQGLATGLVTTAQQVGLTVGIPLLSAIAAARSNALQRAGHSAVDGLLSGIHLALGVDAAILLAVAALLAVGLVGLRRRGGGATSVSSGLSELSHTR